MGFGFDIFHGAIFSDDQKHRFLLWRLWFNANYVLFIGLNPSIANANKDDLTIKKCKGFVKRWNHGGFYMANLSSYISTDPNSVIDDLRDENICYIKDAIKKCSIVIPMWGDNINTLNLNSVKNKIIPLLKNKKVKCFGVTKNGNPKHISRLGYDTKLIDYKL